MNNLNKIFRYSLTDSGESGILRVVNGYAICPKCGAGRKLLRVYSDTALVNAGLFCKTCGTVNISIFSTSL